MIPPAACAAARGALARYGAMWKAASRAAPLPPESFTTSRDTTLVICPVVLGAGRGLFEGVTARPSLKRTQARAFENGSVFLRYEPEQHAASIDA